MRLELWKGRVTDWVGERERLRFEERWCARRESERKCWEALWRRSYRSPAGLSPSTKRDMTFEDVGLSRHLIIKLILVGCVQLGSLLMHISPISFTSFRFSFKQQQNNSGSDKSVNHFLDE